MNSIVNAVVDKQVKSEASNMGSSHACCLRYSASCLDSGECER